MLNSPLDEPVRQLALAEQRLEAMRRATSLEQVQTEWQLFLVEWRRGWTKLKLVCKREGGHVSAWYGRQEHARTTDPLLRYLSQARHSDEHSLARSSIARDGAMTVSPDSAIGSVAIQSVTIDATGQIHYQGFNPLVLQFRPEEIVVVPVTNKGDHFDVPTTHKERPLPSLAVLDLAPLALQDLSERLDEARPMFARRNAHG